MKKIVLFLIITVNIFASIGNIMAIRGNAEVYRTSNKTLTAKSGMKILQQDEINTKARTKVQVMLKDNTVITIGANSSFKFSSYKFDGTKNSSLNMKINRGFFRAVTGRIGKIAPKRFRIKTVSATIGIRGTDFSARITDKLEHFSCHSGKIRIFIGDEFKDLNAGEMFDLKVENFGQVLKNSRNRRDITKSVVEEREERFSPKISEISDITEFQERDEYIIDRDTYPTPNGEPCTTTNTIRDITD